MDFEKWYKAYQIMKDNKSLLFYELFIICPRPEFSPACFPPPRPVILKRVSSVYKKQRGPEGGRGRTDSKSFYNDNL